MKVTFIPGFATQGCLGLLVRTKNYCQQQDRRDAASTADRYIQFRFSRFNCSLVSQLHIFSSWTLFFWKARKERLISHWSFWTQKLLVDTVVKLPGFQVACGLGIQGADLARAAIQDPFSLASQGEIIRDLKHPGFYRWQKAFKSEARIRPLCVEFRQNLERPKV